VLKCLWAEIRTPHTRHRPAKLPLTDVTDRLNDPVTDVTEKVNDTSQTLPTTQIPPYRGHRHIKRLLIQKSDL
jgi:hypothetical protein